MSRTRLEQETIINYNQAEDMASVYTFDPALIRKMDKLLNSHGAASVLRKGEGWAEYLVPKKWIRVQAPAVLSDDQREAMRERGFAAAKNLKKKQEE